MGPRTGPVLAALTALALAVGAAALMVVGHHRWDGRVVDIGVGSHGLHAGDALALVPLLVGLALARWCWTRPA